VAGALAVSQIHSARGKQCVCGLDRAADARPDLGPDSRVVGQRGFSRMDAASADARDQRHCVPVRPVPRRHVVQPDAQDDGDPREGAEGSGLGHLGVELRRLGDRQPRRRLDRPARVNEQTVE